MRRTKARPGLASGGRAPNGAAGADGHGYSPATDVNSQDAVALAVAKRGRLCIVAKVVPLDGEPVLAVAHRHQHGVDSTISIPVLALDYARRAGCRWLYFRRDTAGTMYRLPLAALPGAGHLGPGAGAEWYVAINKMQPVPWRRWDYAERIVRLDAAPPSPQPAARQLALGM